MRFKKSFSWLVLLLIISFFPGCGYTKHTVLPNNIKTIFVATVKNEIPVNEVYAYQPGLEIDITNAVIRRLNKDGNLRVVGDPGKADAKLEASLRRYEQEGVRFTTLESVQEYRLYIVLDVKLTDVRTSQLIWEEPNLSGDAEYFVSTIRTIAQEEASRRAIERLARNVVDRVVEDW